MITQHTFTLNFIAAIAAWRMKWKCL